VLSDIKRLEIILRDRNRKHRLGTPNHDKKVTQS